MDAPKKPLLGLILERESILSGSQVGEILAEQRRRREQGAAVAFGQVALDLKMLTPVQLQQVLKLQAKLAVAPGVRKPIGYYFLEAGLLSAMQIVSALETQKAQGGRIGEILIENGWLQPAMLDVFLQQQAKDASLTR